MNGSLSVLCNDPVLSGRIISMICYVLVLYISWHFLKTFIKNPWYRCAALIIPALQFPALGFASQARGYELSLLCSCVALFTFINYQKDKNARHLVLHIAAMVAGLFTIPTFLYWWAGLALASGLLMIKRKEIDWLYIRIYSIGICLVILLYLPIMTFSGLEAFTGNKYMKAGKGTAMDFIMKLPEQAIYFKGLLNEWFYFERLNGWLGLILLLIPLCLLEVKKQKSAQEMGYLYLALALGFFAISAMTRTLPFYRNLIAHAYIALMCFLIAGLVVIKWKWMQGLFLMICLSVTIYAARGNMERSPFCLYYTDVNGQNKQMEECLKAVPQGRNIYLDDESFYWWAALKDQYPKDQIDMNRKSFRGQDLCIIPEHSAFEPDTALYNKLEPCMGFNFYTRKK